MPSDPNYFDHVIHMFVEDHPLCNATVGKKHPGFKALFINTDTDKVNCRKCLKKLKALGK